MARLQQIYRETIVPQLQRGPGARRTPWRCRASPRSRSTWAWARPWPTRRSWTRRSADLTKITGQKPLICKSRKAIASFKMREGLAIGCKVTLRGARMYEFLDRLISDRDAAHPRLPRRLAARLRRPRQLHAWASRNRSFSPRSSTTRSTRCAAWTSPSRRRRRMTGTAERCSRPSTSRSASKQELSSYGQDEHGRAREASRRDREEVRGEAREAQGADPQPQDLAGGARRRRRRSCRRSRAMRAPSRQRNRCAITGRSRGVYRKFGLARAKIREVASRGEIPGLAKASW